jgi:hypothetical protein
MPMSPELRHFLSHLNVGDRVPLADRDEWSEHVGRISVPGRIAEVTEEQYYYWLEVLPPRFMNVSLFAFAEGAEAFRLFWKDRDGRFWARQLTWDETVTFCSLARIPLPH